METFGVGREPRTWIARRRLAARSVECWSAGTWPGEGDRGSGGGRRLERVRGREEWEDEEEEEAETRTRDHWPDKANFFGSGGED